MDYYILVSGADTRRHLRPANRQLLAVPHFRLNSDVRLAFFSCRRLRSGTLSWISSGTEQPVQTVSDVFSKRIRSL